MGCEGMSTGEYGAASRTQSLLASPVIRPFVQPLDRGRPASAGAVT